MVDVLFVEDDLSLAALLAETAQLVGCEAIIAHDGEAALALLQTLTPPPRLVMADVRMRPMDGITFIRTLRAEPRWAGITIVSTSGQPSDAQAALAAGANVYFPKPFPLETLIRLLSGNTP